MAIGTRDYTFDMGVNGFDNVVRDIKEQSDGQLLVGGRFNNFRGNPQGRIVRLNTDGTKDNSFDVGSGFSSTGLGVFDMVIQPDNKIVVGGEFFTFSGVTAPKVIRLNSDGSIDNTFLTNIGSGVPGGTSSGRVVYSVDLQSNGKIVFTHNANSFDGNDSRGITRLESDGTFDSTLNVSGFTDYDNNPSSGNADVRKVIVLSDDSMIVCGLFTQYDATGTTGITKLTSGGTLDTSFSFSAATNNVVDIHIQGSKYIYQRFGVIYRINEDGSDDNTFNNINSGQQIFIFPDNRILVGQDLYDEDGNFVEDTAINGGVVGGSIDDIVLDSNNKLLYGGDFTLVNGVSENRMTRLLGYSVSAPTLTATTVNDMLEVDLSWTYTDSQADDYELYRSLNGVDYTLISSGTTGTTGYTDTSVNYCTTYYYRVRSLSEVSESDYSNVEEVLIQLTINTPTITGSTDFSTNTVSFNWTNDTGQTAIEIYRSVNAGGFSLIDTVSSGTTGYTQSSLSLCDNTYNYRIRYVNGDCTYSFSNTYSSEDKPTLSLGTLIGEGISIDTIQLNWSIIQGGETAIEIWRNSGSGFLLLDTISSGSTSYIDTPVEQNVLYQYRVRQIYYDCTYNFTNIVEVEIGSLIPFCSQTNPFTVSASTCGNSDGTISINNVDYLLYYNFVLTDVNNVTYPSTTGGTFTGLSSGYYFLEAIPFTNEFRDTCQFEWIELNDSDSTIGVTGQTISQAICGSFDQQDGRIIYEFSGITQPFSYTLYDKNKNINLSGTSNNPLILEGLNGGIYYGIIDDGCSFLIKFSIQESSAWSVPNIKNLYIFAWSEHTDWNNWSTENDDDYYGGVDTLKFQSTKIKEFVWAAEQPSWFYIPIDNINVTFNQVLNKTRQGFTFNNELTMAFAIYDETHWRTIDVLRKNKWTVVFQDNNDNWWTFGYELGAEVNSYTFGSEDAGLKVTFSERSKNKLITALDADYVSTQI